MRVFDGLGALLSGRCVNSVTRAKARWRRGRRSALTFSVFGEEEPCYCVFMLRPFVRDGAGGEGGERERD